ncbi:MAG TPA: sugar ABC transporter ATP-binding protein [Pseudonocardiaceae bacterium]|jgi:ABC-type sugar transport system ATPase subunit
MPVLRASGVSKRYGGVHALDTVDIALSAGEVHGLVGENGAGKSTLVKILSGVIRPDSGTLELAGEPVSFASARAATVRGIAIVSQELSLFPDLTVGENLFPHNAPRRAGLLSRRRMDHLATPVLAELGLSVPLSTRVGDLDIADQQLLEIGRALLARPRVLILDEPTSALPRESVDRLRAVLRNLVGRGIAVLYISHFLEEVLTMAARITVLRDGRTVIQNQVSTGIVLDDLVSAMFGDHVPERVAVRRREAGEVVASFTNVTVPGRLRDVSFTLRQGEIIGLAGLSGSGHRAVLDVLTGRTRHAAGHVTVAGGSAPRSMRTAIRSGVAFVASDRKRYGLMLDKPVWQNTSAVSWLGLSRGSWWLHRDRLAATATEYGRQLRIKADPRDLAEHLSGGNQQKVVFAKWLDAQPALLVLDDPTRGVDVSARAEMHGVIASIAEAGRAVLLASTDLVELSDLADRVLIFQHGRLVRELARDDLSEHALSVAMNAGFAASDG